jgi:glycosyltransferase involved in cell wall biosynthesis
VTWTRSSQKDLSYATEEGIIVKDLKTVRVPRLQKLSFLTRFFLFCLKEKVKLVYLDCWFFTRTGIHLVLPFQALMKAFGVKLLYDARDPFPEYEIACGECKDGTLKTGFYRALSRMLYKISDIILVTSNEFKCYLVRAYAVNPSKIFSAYHGADIKTFNLGASGSKVRDMLGLHSKFVVGWFGVMTHVRQVEQILIPLVKMAEHIEPKAVFLVGGKGRLRSYFERFASREVANVLYIGYIPYDKLANYIAACDIALCPLDSSSVHGRYMLSRKISESLCVGMPVIATKTPAVQSYFRSFRSVYMVDNTPEAFMEAIIDVSKNLDEWRLSAHNEAMSAKLSLQESCRRITDLLVSNSGKTKALGLTTASSVNSM